MPIAPTKCSLRAWPFEELGKGLGMRGVPLRALPWAQDSGMASPMTQTVGPAHPQHVSGDWKLSRAGVPQERAVHRDLDKLDKWDHKSLTRLNKAKAQVLHLARDNPRVLNSSRSEETFKLLRLALPPQLLPPLESVGSEIIQVPCYRNKHHSL